MLHLVRATIGAIWHDAMRLDWCFRTVWVMTGLATGSWVSLVGFVGPTECPPRPPS